MALESRRLELDDRTQSVDGRQPARRLLRVGALGVVGVLALRGTGGLVVSTFRLGQATELFRHWDLRLYSPLCLVLATPAFLAVQQLSAGSPDPAHAGRGHDGRAQ